MSLYVGGDKRQREEREDEQGEDEPGVFSATGRAPHLQVGLCD